MSDQHKQSMYRIPFVFGIISILLFESNFQLRIRALSRILEPKCNDDDVTFHIYVQIAHNVLHVIYICLTLRDVELDLEGI